MKFFLLSLLLVTSVTNMMSQNRGNFVKLSGSADFSVGGVFSNSYKKGWSINATGYESIKGGRVLISAGLSNWYQERTGSIEASVISLKGGYSAFFGKGLYFQGEGGIGFGSKYFKGLTRSVFGGGLGYLFENKTGGGFDISAKLNRGFGLTWLSIGAGYQFKL